MTSSDKIALRSALTRAKGVVDKKLKEEEKRVPRFGVLERFYRKDLTDYQQLYNRIDDIPDCP